jgi:hypothetical protein
VKRLSKDPEGAPKTYRLHAIDSPEAEAVLAKQGITRARLEHALAGLARAGEAEVRTIIGINDDGVFGTSREGWARDLPDAFSEPVIALPWSRMRELLGRAEEGRSGGPEDDPAG